MNSLYMWWKYNTYPTVHYVYSKSILSASNKEE